MAMLYGYVVLKQPQPGKLEIRIVWKSGMLTTRVIDVIVGSLSALPNGDELKLKITQLAKQEDVPDEFIAYTLSKQGFRGSDRPYVGLNLVRRLRSEAGVSRPASRPGRRQHGRFTLGQLAKKLNVKIDWVFEQIIFEKVSLQPDSSERRFWIDVDSEAIGKLEALREAEKTIGCRGEAS